jgi:hypothetical protein
MGEAFRLIQTPPVAGHWRLPGSTDVHSVRFVMASRPRWHVRFLMRLLLGFVWVDRNG